MPPLEVVRLMGLNPEEIARGLAGLPGLSREGSTFRGLDGVRPWRLEVEALPGRSLGSLVLPRSRVTIRLRDCTPREAASFLAELDRRLLRAGG